MLQTERQEKIKSLIESKKNIKISELSKELGVSEMTIHRDLKPLVEEGFIIKTFGGITLVQKERVHQEKTNECVFCHRVINERLSYRLILNNSKVEVACCAHCGLLRHQQLGDQVLQAICYDFLRHTTISASLGWYVMDTSLNIGCCQPQVLAFEYKQHAEQFIKGFGGKLYSFQEAMASLSNKMKINSSHCCTHQES